MRVRQAAERLHVHENTMRYRLRRYAELTGADLTVTEELVGVWWALQRESLDRAVGRLTRRRGAVGGRGPAEQSAPELVPGVDHHDQGEASANQDRVGW